MVTHHLGTSVGLPLGRSKQLGWLQRILLVAAGLRILWVLMVPTAPISDFLWYHERAIDLAQGLGYQWAGVPTSFWAPGYPAALGGLYSIFGVSVWVGKWANVVISVLIVCMTYRVGNGLFRNDRIALVSTALVAVSIRQISFTSVLASEPIFTLVFLLVVEVALQPPELTWRDPVLGGGSAALALIKPFAVAIPALLFLWDLARTRKWSTSLRSSLVIVSVMTASIAPWTYRNWMVFGEFVPLTTNGGYNLFIENVLDLEFQSDKFKEGSPLRPYLLPNGHFDEVAVDRMGSKEAVQWIKEHPVQFIAKGIRRLASTFLSATDVGWSLAKLENGAPSAWYRYVVSWGRGAYLPVIITAGLWLIHDLRRAARSRIWFSPSVIIASTILWFAGIYFLTLGQPRFNFPLLPLWCMAIAAGVLELRDYVLSRRNTKPA